MTTFERPVPLETTSIHMTAITIHKSQGSEYPRGADSSHDAAFSHVEEETVLHRRHTR
jgi:hypothetical protein